MAQHGKQSPHLRRIVIETDGSRIEVKNFGVTPLEFKEILRELLEVMLKK